MSEPATPAARPVVLIGMMGSGKSTIGRRVAAKLGWPFADTDAVIEDRAGVPVSEIFATQGEPAFRQLEADVLRELVTGEDHHRVVATGGGVVVRAENRALLQEHAAVVWLRASPGVLFHRISADGTRPLLGDDPQGALERLMAEREPLYREVANRIVDVDHVDRRLVVECVLRAAAETGAIDVPASAVPASAVPASDPPATETGATP